MGFFSKKPDAERRRAGRAGRAAVADAARRFVENLEQRLMFSTVNLNTASTYQTLTGFGGDYSEGYFQTYAQDAVGQYTLQNLSPQQARVPILLNKWAPTAPNPLATGTINYSNTGEVTQVFQLMQQAQAAGSQVIASIWNVPNWMVSNPSASSGRTIIPSLYGQAATAIAAWLQEAKTVYGVNVADISFNEPDGGNDVLFTSAQLDSFIKTAGPIFQANGVSTKWMVGDTSSVFGSAAYTAPILADSAALPYIGAISMHAWYQYQAPNSELTAIASLGAQYKLPIWSTETNYGPDSLGNYSSWNDASALAQTYLRVLNVAQASAVDYWEYQNDQPLVGPYNSPYPAFFVMQQFEEYLTPGFQVVQSTSNDGNIVTVAAQKGSNFTIDAQNLNTTDTPTTFTNLPNGVYTLITTNASEDSATSAPFTVSSNTLTVTLPANSFNTLTTLAAGVPPTPPAGNGTGLRGVYFSDVENGPNVWSHLVNPTYSEIDPTINFNWGSAPPASSLPTNNYSVQWTGSIQAQYSEAYTFVTTSDDGVRVSVNGQQIINDWTSHTTTVDTSTSLSLTAGTQYAITVQYFDLGTNGTNPQISLGWESPSTPLQVVPSSVLYPNAPTGSGTGLLGQYFINSQGSANDPPATFPTTAATVSRVDPLVDFQWLSPVSTPDPAIPKTYYEAEWTGQIVPKFNETYTFTTISNDGARLWIYPVGGTAGTPTINNWNDESSASTASGTVASMVAGQAYNIVLQYFQATGSNSIDLEWQSPSTPLQDVPTSQLYPASLSAPATSTVSVTETRTPAYENIAKDTNGVAIFQFTRSGGDDSSPLSVNYTMGGTAVNGADYQAMSGVVTFATGYSTATVTLVPAGDPNPGTVQTASLTLTPSGNYTIGTGSAAVSIEEPPVSPVVTATPGSSQVTLNWSAIAGAATYNIYRSSSPGIEGTTPYATGISTTTYTDTSVTNGSTYYYTVTSVADLAESAPSTEVSASPNGSTAVPSAPATLTAAGTNTTVSLSWSAVPGAVSYSVFRGTTSGGESTNAIGTTTNTTYVDTNLSNGTNYYYTVEAVDPAGASTASPQATATPTPLSDADIQSPTLAGSASVSNGIYSVSGAGTDIWSNNDQFNFDSLAVTVGSGINNTLIAQVDSQTAPSSSSKAGLMIRDSSLLGAANAFIEITPSSGVQFQYRLSDNAGTGEASVSLPASHLPIWLRLTDVGNVYTGYYSTQSTTNPALVTWTAVGTSQTIPMTSALAGLAVTSHNTATLSTATFGNLSITNSYGGAAIPAAPATLTATPGAAQVSLTWSAVTGATSYDVYRSTLSGGEGSTPYLTGITTTTTTDSAVTVGTPYYYTVSAFAGASQSSQSTQATATPTAAAGPATLTATKTTNAVTLSWAPVVGASSYSIYRGTTTGGESSTALVGGLTGTTYSDSTGTPGTTYYYIVTASVASGSTSASPEANAAALPSTPGTLSATSGAGQIVLSWATVSGATSYDVYRAQTSGAEGTLATYTGIVTNGYTDTAVTTSGPYYYTVTAVETGVQSMQSTEASASATTVSGPATLTATPSANTISLSWAPVTGDLSYSIYRGTATGGESGTALVSGLTGTTYSDTTGAPGTAYYYIVTASVSSGSTSASPEASAAALPSTPASLSATSSSGQIILSWSAIAGATSYDVYRSQTSGGEGTLAAYTGISTASYTDTAVTTSAPYYYTVTAVENSVQSTQSTEATASASAASGPTTLTATAAVNAINLSWSTVTGASVYSIYRGPAAGGESGTALASGLTGATYSDTSVIPGTGYYYIVKATVVSGLTAASPEATSAALPATPTSLNAVGVAAQILLSWATVPGATSYDVYRSLTSGGEGTLATYSGITSASYTDTSVTAGTPYYYTVTAVEGAQQSPQSTEATGTASATNGPATLTATSATNAINLSWAAVASATSYNIYRGTSPGGESKTPITSGLTGTTYSDTSASPGTTYYYAVIASTPSGPTTPSPEANSAALPSRPATLTATSGAGQVVLSWASVSGATSYDVYRSLTTGGEGTSATYTGITATGYTDTAVTSGTPYFYTVTALVNAVQSTQSSEASATPTAVITIPAAPATLSATAGNATVSLSWAAVSGATTYYVYRGTTTGGESTTAVATTTTTTDLDSGLTNGTAYYYTVKAANSAGTSTASPEATATPSVPVTVPAAPATLSATAGNASVSLSWAAVSGATTYYVFRGTATGGESATAVATTTTTTDLDSGLTNGTAYYYTVKAANSAGTSTASPEATATPSVPVTVPAAPATLSATAGNATVSLSWAAVSGATTYYVYRGTATGGESATAVATTTTTTDLDSGLTNGTAYYYTVKAANSAGTSTASPEATATPVAPAFSLKDSDIGTPAIAGSALVSNGVYTVTGGGTDVWGTSDQFNYDSTSLTSGTGTSNTLVTQVNSQTTASTWSKAGLMIRDSTAAGGANFFVFATPSFGVCLQYRLSDNAATTQVSLTSVTPSTPIWLKIAQVGNVFTAYYSKSTNPAAIVWSQIGTSQTITMPSALGGLAVTGHNAATASTGTFSNLSFTNASSVTTPTAPATLSATAGNASVSLSWSAVSGATTYYVYRGTATGGESATAVATTTTTIDLDNGLTNGTAYYYTVKAANSAGTSTASPEATATPSVPVTVPAAPATLSATAGNASVSLSWAAVSGATTYYVYRGTGTGGESATAVATTTTTTDLDSGLTNGTAYYYTVKAANSAGTSTASPEATATPSVPVTVPAAPATLSATAGNASVSLSWAAVSGATTYYVYRGTGTGGESATAVATTTTTTDLDSGLTNGTAYYYTVKAANSAGTSTASPEATAKPSAPVTAPSAPATLSATAGNATVSLSWAAVSGATTYYVYRGTTTGGESTTAVATTTTTTDLDSGLTNGTAYYYTVKAANSAGTSTASPEAKATPVASAFSLKDSDIGTPAIAGSALVSNGVYTVTGGGTDVWGTSDQFNYDSTSLTSGTGTSNTLVTQVNSQTTASTWSKAGLMIRDSTAAGGANFFVFATPSFGVCLQYRLSDNAATTQVSLPSVSPSTPIWLEIVQVNNTFTAYYSTQSTSSSASLKWTQIGTSQTIAMPSALGGLAVTGHNAATASTATFSNASF